MKLWSRDFEIQFYLQKKAQSHNHLLGILKSKRLPQILKNNNNTMHMYIYRLTQQIEMQQNINTLFIHMLPEINIH